MVGIGINDRFRFENRVEAVGGSTHCLRIDDDVEVGMFYVGIVLIDSQSELE